MSRQFKRGTPLLYKQQDKNGVNDTINWIDATVIDISTTTTTPTQYEICSTSSSVILPRVSQDELECMVLAKQYKDQPMAKDFGDALGGIYKGIVVDVFRGAVVSVEDDHHHDGGDVKILFQVVYSDGDGEDLEEDELKDAIQLYQTHFTSTAATTKKKKRKIAGFKTTGLSSEDDDDDEDEEHADVDDDNGSNSSSGKENHHRKSQRTSVSTKSPTKRRNSKTAPLEITATTSNGRTTRSRRSRIPLSYKEVDSDLENDDDSFHEEEASPPPPTKKPKRSSSRARKVQYQEEQDDDDDEEEEFVQDEASDDEEEVSLSDDSFLDTTTATTTSSSSTSSNSTTRKRKAMTKSKTTTKTGRKTTTAIVKKKTMTEGFTPINRPLYPTLSAQERYKQQYLDPCGQEATDDIISRLVGDQVDKVFHLLQRSLQADGNLGSRTNPLQLGTACSGTDAPALALTLVQEQLELRNNSSVLNFEHMFSCEVEPFKQAYLARNFDSLLYPDISKLKGPDVKDAYGQVQPIPDYNLFVAGTSCKNFSMLRANKRLDIEDKGCSGETFLAAIEHILGKKPPFCIFENVLNAPWDKMAEYIEGKIKLSSCDQKKAITGAKKDEKLEFIYNEDGQQIIVDKVPSVFGVRCGSSVAGYSRPNETTVRPVEWPNKTSSNNKNNKCTLEELLRFNGISKENDTLVFDVPIRYRTAKMKMDTKLYGLPQTRNRMYLFVWRADEGDDLGKYWELVVEHLQSPVRHSLEAFVLQDDHDIIRVFREALRGPAGRTTKRGAFLEPDFWTSTSANLPNNKQARLKLGIEDRARPITEWGPFGKKQVPPHYWLEFLNCLNHRQLDFLDILHASSARDAESHDSSFASFVWNISQSATRERHRTACPGISGCVTPGGEFFLPHYGRPLLGCEKLLLQGIPYFRLALGTETEVQLGDLAGNAMSLTVVGATLLAAICCKQLRTEAQAQCPKDCSLQDQLDCAKKILKGGAVVREPNLTSTPSDETKAKQVDGLKFVHDVADLATEAIESSIWCTVRLRMGDLILWFYPSSRMKDATNVPRLSFLQCESSGQNSSCDLFYQCRVCKISCCQECCNSTAGYQLKSHSVEKKTILQETRKPGAFEAKLRNSLPPTITFEELSELSTTEVESHRVRSLANLNFNLHRISRVRRAWNIVYFAKEDQVGEALAELSIRVGELPGSGEGALLELRSFLPARVEPFVYGPLGPIAVWKCNKATDQEKQQNWVGISSGTSTRTLKVVGSLEEKSFRAELGLTQEAAKGVNSGSRQTNNRKAFAQAMKMGEERRWLYPKNWDTWPTTLVVSGDESSDEAEAVSGTYTRASCRQTVNQGALWIRNGSPFLYILMRPDVSRTGSDFAIISKSMSYEDAASILATFPVAWQPCDALLDEYHIVKEVKFQRFSDLKRMKCLVPTSSIYVTSPNEHSESKELLTVHGLTEAECDMLALHANPKEEELIPLLMATGQKAQQTVRVFNALCLSKILQHAASNGISYDLGPEAEWKTICPADPKIPFGTCTITFPESPKEQWRYDEVRKEWERIYGEGESKAFYEALAKRPHAFEFLLDKKSKLLTVNLNPEVVAHYAAGHLSRGRGLPDDEIEVSVKLCASQFQSDPILDPFVVPGCHKEEPTEVTLKAPYELYERQQKVVSKMLAIENRETIFSEIEMYEEHMPGSTGWSLIAKAQRDARIAGGVIADAIGAGKTVVSIALVLRGLEEARSRVKVARQSSATLVVVPSHLIGQWRSEFAKFTTGLKVICVYDLKSLEKLKVKDLLECDCVICPVDILESSGYLANVIRMSGSEVGDCPKMPTYAGQKELTGATGIWIPATSADPYGGANSLTELLFSFRIDPKSHNQQRRNASARYTYVYLDAVHALRKKDFPDSKKGVPLEYFEWERIIVDEIHESLCCTKEEVDASNNSRNEDEVFKEKNRRAGRELLGIMTRDPSQRPLAARKAIFGLTGTPLLDSSSRVIELASLIGCSYVLGLSSHWRKLERESCRDIFLHYYLEPKQSRVIRRNLYTQCQKYISTACCRNKVGDEMNGIALKKHVRTVQMSDAEGELYLKSQSGIAASKKSFAIAPEDFDVTAGHDITRFLRQNIDLHCRRAMLVKLCHEILRNDPTTKIVVFADGRIGGGISARDALKSEEGLGCTWLDEEDSTEVRNQKISWYQHGDATPEDKARPRILLLHFEHAAGLNLQSECYNVIFYCPLYIGNGGANSDPVSDVSTELQATGRVYRPGQQHPVVNLYRIEVRGPSNQECLDGQLIRRNSDEQTVSMAVNSSD
eukprot:scaffold781_cov132-Cylindrotheca_fusiformis.AAC.11